MPFLRAEVPGSGSGQAHRSCQQMRQNMVWGERGNRRWEKRHRAACLHHSDSRGKLLPQAKPKVERFRTGFLERKEEQCRYKRRHFGCKGVRGILVAHRADDPLAQCNPPPLLPRPPSTDVTLTFRAEFTHPQFASIPSPMRRMPQEGAAGGRAPPDITSSLLRYVSTTHACTHPHRRHWGPGPIQRNYSKKDCQM